MRTELFLALVAMCSLATANISGTNHPSGSCFCFTGSDVNVRTTPCGSSVISKASSGSCYKYKGSKQTCTLSGSRYEFFRLDYGGRDGWAAGNYLRKASDSSCGQPSRPTGTGSTSGVLTDSCLRCMFMTESSGNVDIGCIWDVGSYSCGPYQIKEVYWNECGRPGASWKSCASDKACSETCVRGYMQRYGSRCTGGRTLTCQDYARIHNGGPRGCTKQTTLTYWNKISRCCGGPNGCN